MKKTMLALLLTWFSATAATAGEIKVMAGPNWSKYLFSSEVEGLNREQKSGFGLGVGWAYALNRNMKLEADALYGAQGAKATLELTPGKTIPGIYQNTSIAFPLFFKYQLKEKATPYAALGPEFVFILSHHLRLPESGDDFDLSGNTRKFVLAFNVLLGYEWAIGPWGLFVELRYNRRLGNFSIDPQAAAKSESVALLVGGVYYL